MFQIRTKLRDICNLKDCNVKAEIFTARWLTIAIRGGKGHFPGYQIFLSRVNFEFWKVFDFLAARFVMNTINSIAIHHHHHVNHRMRGGSMF
jgi:hypothetical protein